METTMSSGGWRAFAAALLTLVAAGPSCGGRASAVCSADPSPSPSAVLMDLHVDVNAGGTPFALGAPLVSAGGVDYQVNLLRFYLSHFALVDAAGAVTPAILADADGAPLRYGVTLVDLAKPASQSLHLLAPPGRYEALSVSVGVPQNCSGGTGILNHENASEQSAPLDVDSDMYWGWDPGYVFFKIEGRTTTPGAGKAFLFHLGDDKRYATAIVPAVFELSGPAQHGLAIDIKRLFVSPDGTLTPDITGATTSNIVHGGKEADAIVNNLKSSEVFSWND